MEIYPPAMSNFSRMLGHREQFFLYIENERAAWALLQENTAVSSENWTVKEGFPAYIQNI